MRVAARCNARDDWAAKRMEFDLAALSADTRYVFANGQCHALAIALHHLTGWPMIGGAQDGDSAAHVWVVTPEGHTLDSYGIDGEFREIPEDLDLYDDPAPVSEEDLRAWSELGTMFPITEHAEAVARLVLEEYYARTAD